MAATLHGIFDLVGPLSLTWQRIWITTIYFSRNGQVEDLYGLPNVPINNIEFCR